MSLIETRFWNKVNKTETCWNWIGSCSRGYGTFSKNSKSTYAHRVAYELMKGPIPKDLQIDHLCKNKSCVNPDHLEAVSCRENILRGHRGLDKTKCKHGHLVTKKNTYVTKKGTKLCKLCNKEAYLVRKERKGGEVMR